MLRTMHDRLASVSHEISDLLGKVEWHSEAVPPNVRLHVRTAAGDIVRTQEWLNQRMGQLPLDPGHRYAAMQEMLQVQFVALQKVTQIVNDLVALRSRLQVQEPHPQQGQIVPFNPHGQVQGHPQPHLQAHPQMSVPAHPQAGMLPPLGAPQPQVPFARDFGTPHPAAGHAHVHGVEPEWGAPPAPPARPQQGPAVRLSDLGPAAEAPRTGGQRASKTGPRDAKASQKAGKKSRAEGASNRKLALIAGVLLGAIVVLGISGYIAYTKLGTKQTAARSAPKKERVSIGDPAAREQALSNAAARGDGPSRVPSPPPMAAPPLDDAASKGQLPGLVVVQPSGPRPDPRAQALPFVAVIATHRDKQALAKIYNDLRKQYPSVLGPKKADAQTVNLGENGVWHHLVLLPPGSREQAEGTCAELKAAGYARCMVRPY